MSRSSFARTLYLSLLLTVMMIFSGGCGASGSGGSSDVEIPRDEPTPSAAQMTITTDAGTLTVDLEDNEAARDLVVLLSAGDVEVDMRDYNDMEKVGSLPRAFARNDENIRADVGDVMLYQGNNLVIFYGANEYAYTRIGRVKDATRESMLSVLGEGDVKVRLSNRSMAEDRYVTLNDGRKMPKIGYGTWTISDSDAEELVYHAIKNGYRLIDTARYYGNEAGVGRGVRRAIADGTVKREDVFVTTKIVPAGAIDYDAEIDKCSACLGIEYIDLMLIHQRGSGEKDMYRAMERAVARGVVRSIGISNYYTPQSVRDVTAGATIMPAVIQNECHPFYQNAGLRGYAAEIGAVIESYYPLGGRGHTSDVLGDPRITRIAAAHGKTAAQTVLRWHVQAGFIAIPGSSSKAHIEENIDIFDFALTDAEMAEIAGMDTGNRYENW